MIEVASAPTSTSTKNGDLIIGRRVKDTPVFNTFGDKIGSIEDFSIEKASGRVRYALMSFGGFLSIGENSILFPGAYSNSTPHGTAM